MRKIHCLMLGLCLMVMLSLALGSAGPGTFPGMAQPAPDCPKPEADARIGSALRTLTLQFEENRGQVDERVKFLARGPGYSLFITGTEAVFALPVPVRNTKAGTFEQWRTFTAFTGADLLKHIAPDTLSGNFFSPSRSSGTVPHLTGSNPFLQSLLSSPEPQLEFRTDVLRVKLAGAKPGVPVTASGKLPGVVNYFIGNDPEQWRTNIPTYRKVKLAQVYRGIDLVYYGRYGLLEYDFVVAPGADPSVIALEYEGADSLEIDKAGNLIAHMPGGDISQLTPEIYQVVDGSRRKVAGNYVLRGNNRIGFRVSDYVASLPLTIDPAVSYSTYLGGTFSDSGQGIAVDSAGCTYVTGYTTSPGFPTFSPYRGTYAGGAYDMAVSKFNAAGNALLYSTFIGGNSADLAFGIAVDSSGCAYISGHTSSFNYPVQNPFQAVLAGSYDVALTKLNSSGNALVYSTYLGGINSEYCYNMAIDSTNRAYIIGMTASANFPTQNPYQGSFAGGAYDVCVSRFSAAGNSLEYSTFLGGNDSDNGRNIAVDSSGCAYLTGATSSANFPTRNPYQGSLNGAASDSFVTRINSSGTGLDYSTYLGGSSSEYGYGIAVDSTGCAWVAGNTASINFPTRNPYQAASAGSGDVFVTRFSADGSALVYSTYLGGTNSDYGYGLAVDSSGGAYVSGHTLSIDFPTQNPIQAANAGGQDIFLSKFSASGNSLSFSTYQGGANFDYSYDLALDSTNCAYITGYTQSNNFPVQNAFQGVFAGGSGDYCLVKFSEINPNGVSLSPASAAGTGNPGAQAVYTLTVRNTGTVSDTFSLSKSVSPWSAALSSDTIGPLAPGASQDITCTVTIPPGALQGESQAVTVTATSQGDAGASGASTLTTTANLVRGVTLSTGSAAGTTNPGSTLTYTLTLKNTGNGPDTYTISNTGNAWGTNLSQSSVTLAAGAQQAVNVDVTVPPAALAGVTDQVTVTAASDNDGSVTAQSVLTTTAGTVRGVQVNPVADNRHAVPGNTLTYTLSVTNKGNAADSFTVTHTTPEGWITSVVPGTVANLAVNATATVTVTAAIPANALKDDSETATVTLTSQSDGSQTANATLTTTADLIRGLVMTPAAAGSTAAPGTGSVYTLTLNNTGNDSDTFSVNAVSSEGWTLTVPASPVTVAPYSSAAVDITVNVPPGAPAALEDTTTVTATSTFDGTVTDSSVLTTTAGTVRAVGISPAAAAGSGKPAVLVSYTLTVTNNGNGTDTFDITNTSTWPCTLSAAEVADLASGASSTITATVEIPDGIAMNSTGTTTVTVTSRSDNTKTSQAVLTTTAERVCKVAVTPAAQSGTRDPGTGITYTATVKNNGNAADTFAVSANSSRGWLVVPSKTTVGPLAPGVSENITVTVSVPPAETPVIDTETLSFVSQQDTAVSASCTLTTTAAATAGVSITPATTGASGEAGAAVTFSLTVQNTSNASDTYTLTLSGNAWQTAVTEEGAATPVTEFTLGAGESKNAAVTVTIPNPSANGASDTAVIKVSSKRNPSKTASAAVTTTSTGVAVIAPILLVPQDGTTVRPTRPERIDFKWNVEFGAVNKYHCHLFVGTKPDLSDATVVDVPLASASSKSAPPLPLASLPLLCLGGFLIPGWRNNAQNRSRLFIAMLVATALVFTFITFTGCGGGSTAGGTAPPAPPEVVTINATVENLPVETTCFWKVDIVDGEGNQVTSSDIWRFTISGE